MDDLISRQAVIDLLKKNLSKDIEEVIVTDKNIKLIESMPCAYDVDAVVAELEKERMRYFLTIANGNDENMNLAYCKISNAIDTANDIVRKGGVE